MYWLFVDGDCGGIADPNALDAASASLNPEQRSGFHLPTFDLNKSVFESNRSRDLKMRDLDICGQAFVR